MLTQVTDVTDSDPTHNLGPVTQKGVVIQIDLSPNSLLGALAFCTCASLLSFATPD